MNNNIIELTDIEVVEELKNITQELRDVLESLLEDSEDEEHEKANIAASLEGIQSIFSMLGWQKAASYSQEALKHVEELSAFGEGDAENFLLRFCLLIEQSIEIFSELGVILETDIIEDFNSDDSQDSEGANTTLLKLLRTLYQKQLLMLIKGDQKATPLNALNALSRDISSSLPSSNSRNWLLLSFYLQALLKEECVLDIETHRLLASLDVHLSDILNKKILNEELSSDLMAVVQKLNNGQNFIDNNILMQDIYSISPAVYKRFGLALKDELVKIHEQLERIYLDQVQRLRLEDSIPFIQNLINVLNFMGLKRLALLTEELLESFKQLLETSMNESDFNVVVSRFWVLESFIANLWGRREQIVPLSYQEMQNWAYISAKSSALRLYVSQYQKIHEQILKTSEADELKALQQKLFDTVKAESVLSIAHGLTRHFVEGFMSVPLSKESLLEVTLAIEYISNMNLENREIVAEVIHNASLILQQHLVAISEADAETNSMDFDEDVILACRQDLNDLEREFNQCINIHPMNSEAYESLIRIAHTLRGNANVVGLKGIVQLASVLEDNLRANKSYSNEKIEVYHKAFVSIIEQFKEFLQKLN